MNTQILFPLCCHVFSDMCSWTENQSHISIDSANAIYAVLSEVITCAASLFGSEFLSGLLDNPTFGRQHENNAKFVHKWTHIHELRDILAEKQNLLTLTAEFKAGKYESFDRSTLKGLICALYDDSSKRQSFIALLNINE